MAVCVRNDAGSVAHQATCRSKFAKLGHCGQQVAGGQCCKLISLVVEQRICGDDERTSTLFDNARKGRIDLGFGTGAQYSKLSLQDQNCLAYV